MCWRREPVCWRPGPVCWRRSGGGLGRRGRVGHLRRLGHLGLLDLVGQVGQVVEVHGLVVRDRCGSALTTTALFGAGVGLLSRRAEDHDHVAAVLLRARLDVAQLVDVLGQTLQEPEAQLGPRLLTTAEHDRHLDLVAGLEEALDVALLGAVVVRVDLRTELDLLDDRVDLVLACFPGLERGFVLELAEVHELGDRGPGHGGHLDQVEVRLRSQSQRVFDADDPDLFAVGADQAHFRDPDALVDARLADVVLLLWGQWE